ncbi:hypothetical protein RDI58_025153 [Solanum bulbocastanum]|uniref:Uncharacterized protein n=1 Tax=Solanum bulbocastanum TaxID=147425 RepID=A0AAN8Y3K2_SOLBU
MIVSSSASSSWFNNNKKIDDHQEIRILNVDFRALFNNTSGGSEFRGHLLPDTGRTVNEETNIRLVNASMACAEAIQENNLTLADLESRFAMTALLQALALLPGGPPAFRLSGISVQPKSHEGSDPLQEVGFKLAQFAESIGVEFEFHGFLVHILADLEAPMLSIRPSNVEAVAVNSVFELHRLFSIPGAFEEVLDLIKPKIVTIPNKKGITVGVAI